VEGKMTVIRTAIIADDDEDIRQLVVISAKKAGIEIVAAVDNGLAAWDAVSRGGIDLAILDISMPGLNGLQVADRIRADASLVGTRVLMVSASVQMLTGDISVPVSGRRDDRFILKPFSPRELTNTITEMLAEED
jgi:two-component system, OmpR family, response regulator